MTDEATDKATAKAVRAVRGVTRWHIVHKWSSLICTVFVLMACFTGLPLVFSEEIDRFERWIAGEVNPPDAAPTLSIDKLAATAGQERPDAHVQLLWREPSDPGIVGFAMGETVETPVADAEFLRIDEKTGQSRSAERIDDSLMGVLFLLHTELYSGQSGTLFLGVMAALFMTAIVSGIVLYAPFMRHRAFAVIRVKKGRARWLDLHNALGIVLGTWMFVVSATGMINTWGSPMIQYWLLNDMQQMVAHDTVGTGEPKADLASVQEAIDLAARKIPDGEFSFVAFPGSEFSSDRHYLIMFTGKTPVSSRLLMPAIVNAHSGELIATPDLPWYLKTFLLSQPPHFGDYGGLGLKIAWFLLDFAMILLLSSGLVLWWRKRHEPPEIDIVGAV